MAVKVEGADALRALAGKELGATEWEPMEFSRITAFAGATDDHQWIHVDRERIARESPFGAPIAHGYLTLALVAGKFFELVELDGFQMIINYGTNKVRFPNPLKEGDNWRLAMAVGDVTDKRDWIEVIFHARIEVEGADKPACAAECIYRVLPR